MTAGESTTYVLGQLALPPTSLLALALAGAVLARRRPTVGLPIVVASVLLALALSTTFVARTLIGTLEPAPLQESARRGAQVIVVLAGGRVRASPEWGGDTTSVSTLRRLRYGAWLARETGLPVLLSGGDPDRAGVPEARLMQVALERDFGVRARWIEGDSKNTAENARLTAALLAPLGLRRVLLVTDAHHMPRAQRAFASSGLTPIAAPTGYVGTPAFRLQHLVPNAEAMRISQVALREWAAGVWYRLRG